MSAHSAVFAASELRSAIAKEPLMVTSEVTVKSAIASMQTRDVSYVLVTAGLEEHTLSGIFTERDLARVSLQSTPLDQLPIGTAMSHPVVTLRASEATDIAAVLALFQQHSIRHIPVLDDGDRVIGVIEFDQLSKLLARQILQPDVKSAPAEQAAIAPQPAQAEAVQNPSGFAYDSQQAEELLKIQNAILEKIAKGEPLPEILDALLQAMEAQLGHALCSILLCDGHQLHHGAAPHLPPAYVQAIDGIAIGEAVGSCGTAAFRGTPVIVSDIATDPLWQNFQALALSHGLRACWSMPVRASDGRVLGTFAVYHREIYTPNDSELAVANLAANIAGIAIERQQVTQSLKQLNQELEHKVEERTAALRASEERWQLVLKGTNDGIWDWDLKTNTFFFSSRWKQMRGFANEEIGNSAAECLDRIHPDDYDHVVAAINDHIAGKTEFFESEYRTRHKDGSYLWVLDRAQALHDESGHVIRMSGSETDITQRKQAEEALRQSERRYSTLAAAAPVAIFRFDGPLNCIYVNERWSEMTGRPKESALGDGWIEALHPDDRNQLVSSWVEGFNQATLETRNINQSEGRHLRPDGTVNWFYVQVAQEIDTKGRVTGYIGTLTDITEHKLTEAALRKSKQRYRALMDGASDAILLANAQGQLIDANQRAESLLGYSRDELIHLHVPQIHPPEALEAVRNHFKTIFLHNRGPAFESTVLRKDGSAVPVEITASRIEVDGEPIAQGIFRDISDRKLTEAALRESEERFRSAFDTTAVGMCLVSPDGQFLKINASLCAIWGYSEAELLELSFQEITYPADLALDLEFLEKMLAGEVHNYTLEKRYVTKQGQIIWGLLSVSLIRDSRDRPLYFVSHIQDITNRKQAEQQLRDVSDRLNLALQSAQIGTWEWDTTTDKLFWDDHTCSIFGVNPEEFSGTYADWEKQIHPDDLESQRQTHQKTFCDPNKTHDQIEFRIIRPDGSIRIVSANAIIQRDSNGNALRIIGLNTDITERRQAELENQKLKERLQFVLSSSPAVIFTADVNGTFGTTFISDNIYPMVGYSPAEIIADSNFWADHLHPEDAPRIVAEIPHLFEQGHHIHEYRFRHQTGRYIWVQAELRLIYDNHFHPIEIVGYLANISDRKHTEEELKLSRDLREAIFNESADALFLVDPYTLLTLDCNQRAVQLFEANDKAELIGIAGHRLQRRPFNQSELAKIVEEMNTNGFWFREIEYVTLKGRTFWGNIAAKSITVTERTMNLVRVTDVSDRKRLEQEQNRLTAILQASTDYISMADASGTIFWKNAELKRLCGLDCHEDLLCFQLTDCHPQWAADLITQQGLPAAIATGSWVGETAVLNAEQQEIPVSQLILAHKSTEGDIEFFSFIMRDIRARKEYEQQLEYTNAELLRATRLKDEFLANMSHELRTPLNAVLGLSEALQDEVFGPLNERQKRSLSTIERSGQHLLELINDVLDVAKIESGQTELEFTATSVAHLCQSSLVLIQQQAVQKRIQIQVVLQPQLPDLMVDERRMRQVLINLLNNAVKFTPPGGQITVEVTQRDKAGIADARPQPTLCISIKDTGIGIAPENINRLFQPFIQIDSALNRQYAGTGLGLALVKRIVELHGGRVLLTSKLGTGSCFTVELPYPFNPMFPSIVPPGYPQGGTPILDAVSANDATEQTPLILLAEDNEANIATVSSYLRAKGYCVVLAKNGHDAIALAKTHHPNLILMDIQMPGLDGLEAIRQIRLDPTLVDVPIVALTALAMNGDRDRCLEAGANDYLTKPVRLKQLVTTIQQLLATKNLN